MMTQDPIFIIEKNIFIQIFLYILIFEITILKFKYTNIKNIKNYKNNNK